MTLAADLGDCSERDRVAIIRRAVEAGNIVGVFVDNDAEADRYLRLLGASVRVVERRRDALIKDSVFLKLGPPES